MAEIKLKKRYKYVGDIFQKLIGIGFNVETATAFLNEVKDADVQEIKHGYWIDKPTGRYCHIGSYCSVCEEKSGIGGIESNRHKPYCPNCGARMDGTPKERGGEK